MHQDIYLHHQWRKGQIRLGCVPLCTRRSGPDGRRYKQHSITCSHATDATAHQLVADEKNKPKILRKCASVKPEQILDIRCLILGVRPRIGRTPRIYQRVDAPSHQWRRICGREAGPNAAGTTTTGLLDAAHAHTVAELVH